LRLLPFALALSETFPRFRVLALLLLSRQHCVWSAMRCCTCSALCGTPIVVLDGRWCALIAPALSPPRLVTGEHVNAILSEAGEED